MNRNRLRSVAAGVALSGLVTSPDDYQNANVNLVRFATCRSASLGVSFVSEGFSARTPYVGRVGGPRPSPSGGVPQRRSPESFLSLGRRQKGK